MNGSPFISDKIISDIVKEREYASSLWDRHFDKKNTLNDWVSYICQYIGRAAKVTIAKEVTKRCKEEQRINLVKVAALAISAIEAFDHNDGFPPRHYDEA